MHFGVIFLTAVFVQGAYALVICLTGLAVDIRVPFQMWPIYQPLLATTGLIPASISGFGADQAASVYFMGLVGVPAALAFAASFLLSVLNLVISVVGGGIASIFVSERAPSRRAEKRRRQGRSEGACLDRRHKTGCTGFGRRLRGPERGIE